MTQPLTTDQIEELLEAEVPCGGIRNVYVARSCGRPAVLQRVSRHGCADDEITPASFKCLPCWQTFYSYLAGKLARKGAITCGGCGQRFASIEAFSDFRPF